MKIKICGLTRECDIRYANELPSDYIGFVFYEKSRRYVEPNYAAKLRKGLCDRIKPVGVFVNAPVDDILNCIKIGAIDIVQLHGNEDNEYIKALRSGTDAPVIKAFLINDKTDIKTVEESAADFVLLDNGFGEGRAFDWGLAKNIKRPYFLAGGLKCENVKEAVGLLKPYAVDVSSGVEEKGFKSYDKMKKFIEICKKTEDKPNGTE